MKRLEQRLFYAKLNILKLNNLIHFEKACFLFRFKSHKRPYIFNNYCIYTSNTHDKYTRGSSCVAFCPIVEITNCKDQLNIKVLRHETLWNLL